MPFAAVVFSCTAPWCFVERQRATCDASSFLNFSVSWRCRRSRRMGRLRVPPAADPRKAGSSASLFRPYSRGRWWRSWVDIEALEALGVGTAAASFAADFAIVTGCYYSALELARDARASEPDDLINSMVGGLANGALLGRLQGRLSKLYFLSFFGEYELALTHQRLKVDAERYGLIIVQVNEQGNHSSPKETDQDLSFSF